MKADAGGNEEFFSATFEQAAVGYSQEEPLLLAIVEAAALVYSPEGQERT